MKHQELLRKVAHRFEASDQKTLERYRSLADYFTAGQCVLDVGCGRGVFMQELLQRGIKAIGIDLDEERVQQCCNQGLEVHLADANHFVDRIQQRLDGVSLMHIIEHLDGEDALRLLNRATGALKPGGKLLIVTPNIEHPLVYTRNFWLDITHKRPYPLLLLKAALEILGLDVLSAGEAPWHPADLLVVASKGKAT